MSDLESKLLERAITGDIDALTELLERHGEQIHSRLAIAKRWQSVLSADDVMQITYLEAFLRIGQFRPGQPGGFAGWLQRIAGNNLRDAIRYLQRRKRVPPTTIAMPQTDGDSFVALFDLLTRASETPSRKAEHVEIQSAVRTALASLPPDYEQAVRLCDLEGQTAAVVARKMGRSVGSVYMLRARAHDRLREVLGSASRFLSTSA